MFPDGQREWYTDNEKEGDVVSTGEADISICRPKNTVGGDRDHQQQIISEEENKEHLMGTESKFNEFPISSVTSPNQNLNINKPESQGLDFCNVGP